MSEPSDGKRPHLKILIVGERGSGATTLAAAVLFAMRNEPGGVLANYDVDFLSDDDASVARNDETDIVVRLLDDPNALAKAASEHRTVTISTKTIEHEMGVTQPAHNQRIRAHLIDYARAQVQASLPRGMVRTVLGFLDDVQLHFKLISEEERDMRRATMPKRIDFDPDQLRVPMGSHDDAFYEALEQAGILMLGKFGVVGMRLDSVEFAQRLAARAAVLALPEHAATAADVHDATQDVIELAKLLGVTEVSDTGTLLRRMIEHVQQPSKAAPLIGHVLDDARNAVFDVLPSRYLTSVGLAIARVRNRFGVLPDAELARLEEHAGRRQAFEPMAKLDDQLHTLSEAVEEHPSMLFRVLESTHRMLRNAGKADTRWELLANMVEPLSTTAREFARADMLANRAWDRSRRGTETSRTSSRGPNVAVAPGFELPFREARRAASTDGYAAAYGDRGDNLDDAFKLSRLELSEIMDIVGLNPIEHTVDQLVPELRRLRAAADAAHNGDYRLTPTEWRNLLDAAGCPPRRHYGYMDLFFAIKAVREFERSAAQNDFGDKLYDLETGVLRCPSISGDNGAFTVDVRDVLLMLAKARTGALHEDMRFVVTRDADGVFTVSRTWETVEEAEVVDTSWADKEAADLLKPDLEPGFWLRMGYGDGIAESAYGRYASAAEAVDEWAQRSGGTYVWVWDCNEAGEPTERPYTAARWDIGLNVRDAGEVAAAPGIRADVDADADVGNRTGATMNNGPGSEIENDDTTGDLKKADEKAPPEAGEPAEEEKDGDEED